MTVKLPGGKGVLFVVRSAVCRAIVSDITKMAPAPPLSEKYFCLGLAIKRPGGYPLPNKNLKKNKTLLKLNKGETND